MQVILNSLVLTYAYEAELNLNCFWPMAVDNNSGVLLQRHLVGCKGFNRHKAEHPPGF